MRSSGKSSKRTRLRVYEAGCLGGILTHLMPYSISVRASWTTAVLLSLALASPTPAAEPGSSLEQGWQAPPVEARLRAYWWWLNGNVTKPAITRDLEEMAARGFGGALICDAGGAEQDGNDRVPHGPTFFTPEWRELYKHTLREADRLGLEMGLNIQSGWNLGGPMVKAEDAPKRLVWSETRVTGPAKVQRSLPKPKYEGELYRDVAVVACPVVTLAAQADSAKSAAGSSEAARGSQGPRLLNWQEKALHKALHFSAPDTALMFEETPAPAGESYPRSSEVIDLSDKLSADGKLTWDAPAGEWEILRIGCALNLHCRVSTCSDGWQGYAIDPFDADAFRKYWQAIVEPLIADAGPLAGRALKFLHTDSWEVEVANWTPTLREEFRKRRGYDLWPYLPVIAGRILDDRNVSNRLLHDLRKTMGDLAIDNHYRLFVDGAHRHGLLIHPESGGPHAVPIDSLRCLGMDDAPMSEFWARSWRHRVTDENRFFVKQPASAAHTYGRRLVLAEGFTTIGPHWQETLWDNLKPSFDRAACEGLNLLVWHAFTCSPAEMGLPGQEYFAGTHFNPNSTWWPKSGPFLAYINRCQYMLQRGLFVADAVYYYGDHVPNFTQLKQSDPAKVLPGYDYDVATEEVLLTRMSVRDGRIVLPDGMSYRVLVLPNRRIISLPVLRKVKELVEAGATVIGPRPEGAAGLRDFPACDGEVKELANQLWGEYDNRMVRELRFGKGRVVEGRTARVLLLKDGVKPDFEYALDPGISATSPASQPAVMLDYIHRLDGAADIYFVVNRSSQWVDARCTFRGAGKAPECWDPVTGWIRDLPDFAEAEGRTVVPLRFAPYGSMFVVFRTAAGAIEKGMANFPMIAPACEIRGPWQVNFDPKRGGPQGVEFPQLVSWTTRPEDAIRFYSGAATYSTTFDLPAGLPAGKDRLLLDLGNVRQLCQVRLNGQDFGALWAMPLRVDVTEVVRPQGNKLEVDVVNFWPNRIIGDQSLPPEKRTTRTNIRRLTKDTPLVESGLLGPVQLMSANPTPGKK